MIAILHDGSTRHYCIGEALVGVGFKSVTLTQDDVGDRNFVDWFENHVLGRFEPPMSQKLK